MLVAGSSSSSRADGDCPHRRTWHEVFLRVPQRWPNSEPPRGADSFLLHSAGFFKFLSQISKVRSFLMRTHSFWNNFFISRLFWTHNPYLYLEHLIINATSFTCKYSLLEKIYSSWMNHVFAFSQELPAAQFATGAMILVADCGRATSGSRSGGPTQIFRQVVFEYLSDNVTLNSGWMVRVEDM